MNIKGRRGIVNDAVVGPCRSDFHDSCRTSNGAEALIRVTEDFAVEEVSNRVAFRLFVDVDGISRTGDDWRHTEKNFAPILVRTPRRNQKEIGKLKKKG